MTDPSVYPMMAVGLICASQLLKIYRAFWELALASDFFIGNQSVPCGAVAQGGGGLSWVGRSAENSQLRLLRVFRSSISSVRFGVLRGGQVLGFR